MACRPVLERARAWAAGLERDVLALWFAVRDPRVSWPAKAVAGLVVAYALSPIDLIPDVIPVLGLVDDLLLVPLGVALATRLIPPPLLADLREAASGYRPRASRVGLAIVLLLWALAGAALIGAVRSGRG